VKINKVDMSDSRNIYPRFVTAFQPPYYRSSTAMSLNSNVYVLHLIMTLDVVGINYADSDNTFWSSVGQCRTPLPPAIPTYIGHSPW